MVTVHVAMCLPPAATHHLSVQQQRSLCQQPGIRLAGCRCTDRPSGLPNHAGPASSAPSSSAAGPGDVPVGKAPGDEGRSPGGGDAFDVERELDGLLPVEVKEQRVSGLIQSALCGVALGEPLLCMHAAVGNYRTRPLKVDACKQRLQSVDSLQHWDATSSHHYGINHRVDLKRSAENPGSVSSRSRNSGNQVHAQRGAVGLLRLHGRGQPAREPILRPPAAPVHRSTEALCVSRFISPCLTLSHPCFHAVCISVLPSPS